MSTAGLALLGFSERRHAASILVAGLGLLVVAAALHVGIGPSFIGPGEVVAALVDYDPRSFDHRIIVQIRLVRLLAAIIAGGALGMAGAVLQGLTRNPLAGPEVIGINAGAALAVVLSMSIFGTGLLDGFSTPWIAALGGSLVFAVVMALSSAGKSGPTPLKVTLTGVAVSALAGSFTSAVMLLDDQSMTSIRTWLAGNLAGMSYATLAAALPAIVIGALGALWVSGQLNMLALGEQAATGLGLRTRRTRFIGLVAAALLCGGSVSIAGPIGFVGLVVPHIVKQFVPTDQRFIVPLSALYGAVALVISDIAARTILLPEEIATGIMTAILGGPAFVALVASKIR